MKQIRTSIGNVFSVKISENEYQDIIVLKWLTLT